MARGSFQEFQTSKNVATSRKFLRDLANQSLFCEKIQQYFEPRFRTADFVDLGLFLVVLVLRFIIKLRSPSNVDSVFANMYNRL